MSFLNSVLGLDGERAIVALEFSDRETMPMALNDRVSRLDVLVTTGRGEFINIEVQVAHAPEMEKRSLYYWAKLFGAQLKSGGSFRSLRKTVAVNVLGFNLYPTRQWHWEYALLDRESRRPFDDVIEIHFVEVPKFRSQNSQVSSSLERWMTFLANVEGEVMDGIAESDATIKKALGVADMLKQNELDRLLYLRYQMKIHEEITAREASLEEGMGKGIEIGRTEGVEIGRTQGIAIGEARGLIRAASVVAGNRFPSLTPEDNRRLEAAAARDPEGAMTAVSTCGGIGELRTWLAQSEAGSAEE